MFHTDDARGSSPEKNVGARMITVRGYSGRLVAAKFSGLNRTIPWKTLLLSVLRSGRRFEQFIEGERPYSPSFCSHKPKPTPIEYASLTERSTWDAKHATGAAIDSPWENRMSETGWKVRLAQDYSFKLV